MTITLYIMRRRRIFFQVKYYLYQKWSKSVEKKTYKKALPRALLCGIALIALFQDKMYI